MIPLTVVMSQFAEGYTTAVGNFIKIVAQKGNRRPKIGLDRFPSGNSAYLIVQPKSLR